MTKIIPLTEMKNGDSGTVMEIHGGDELHRKLKQLGIRKGITLTKTSSTPGRGPTVVRTGHTQASFGYGISRKIMMEIQE